MMANKNSLNMKKLLGSLLTGAAIFTVAGSASATGMDTPATVGAHAGGLAGSDMNSSGHMSTEGNANQNSQMSPGATRSIERAHERMNEMGSEHERATVAETTSKHLTKARHKGKSMAKGQMQQ